MSFQLAIPWQVALQHCLPPLHQLDSFCSKVYWPVDEFSANGDNLNFVSHSSDSVQARPPCGAFFLRIESPLSSMR
jgi:hypothetical protein